MSKIQDLFQVQLRVADLAFAMMKRGVRSDRARVRELKKQVKEMMAARITIVEEKLGHPLERNKQGNFSFMDSNQQIHAFFTSHELKGKKKRGVASISYDDDALFTIGKQVPEFMPFVCAIIEYRSLGKAFANFLEAECEPGGRLRTTFNSAGPETFRWSSSTNCFWRGTNIQNIGGSVHKVTLAEMPAYKTCIIPDEGYLLLEPDLKGADAQVVAWDSGDATLKDMCKQGVKIAAVRAKMLFGNDAGPDGTREPYYTRAKSAGHGWTYGGKARTLAAAAGVTVKEMEAILKKLEAIHPGIVAWQARIQGELASGRAIENAFGYRITYFGRPADALTKALAWIGQGTVACVINRVGLLLAAAAPEAPLLINNHDSWVLQCKLADKESVKQKIKSCYDSVIVPYPEPLCIPPDLKVSERSWGEMVKEKW